MLILNDCIVNLQHGKHYNRPLDICGNICDRIFDLPFHQLPSRLTVTQDSLQEWRYSGLTTYRHYPVRFVCLQASDVAPILSYICKEFNSTLSHDRKAEKRNQLPGVQDRSTPRL